MYECYHMWNGTMELTNISKEEIIRTLVEHEQNVYTLEEKQDRFCLTLEAWTSDSHQRGEGERQFERLLLDLLPYTEEGSLWAESHDRPSEDREWYDQVAWYEFVQTKKVWIRHDASDFSDLNDLIGKDAADLVRKLLFKDGSTLAMMTELRLFDDSVEVNEHTWEHDPF